MRVEPIDPDAFIATVQPLLEQKNTPGLLKVLKTNWSSEQLRQLLISPHTDAKKVAALAVGLVGTRCCIPQLAAVLQDPDPFTNQITEHALWSIWFRLGSDSANHHLHHGSAALNRREFDHANRHFSKAIELDPNFAEAYNQRAIANYLSDAYEASMRDCQAAVERMPCHFGAWAGMGHCYAHLGHAREALRCYEQALTINPHLTEVAEAIRELRQTLGEL